MTDFFAALLQGVLVLAVPVLAAFLAKLLNSKADEARQKIGNEALSNAVGQAVVAAGLAVDYVAQTYVDKLKEADRFSLENQKEAFKMAKEEASWMITEEAKEILQSSFGELEDYITTLIEAQINRKKPQ